MRTERLVTSRIHTVCSHCCSPNLPERFERGEDFVSNFCSCLFQEKALGFGDTPMPLLRDCVENLVTDGIKENHFHAPIT